MIYEVGHKCWVVKSRWIEPEKKTDENGVVWKKVTFDSEYYVVEGEVVGSIEMKIQGRSLWDDEPFFNQYAVKTSDGYMESVAEDDMESADWAGHIIFHSKEEAIEYVKVRNAS